MVKEAEERAAFERILSSASASRVVAEDSLTARHAVSEESSPVVYFAGQRIYFRPLERSDEPTLRRWINDPRNWPTLLHRGPVSGCRELEWIESLGKNRSEYVFGVVLKDQDRLIGSTGLHAVDSRTRSATFGLLIGEVAYQNKGYGSEATRLALKYAFRELNLNRVALSVFANNWRAIRAYQKAGFVPEGCLRQAQYSNGDYVDEYRFAILREEWESLPSLVTADRYHPARSQRSVEVA